MKRKYPRLIVLIFLFQLANNQYRDILILLVMRFLRHGTYHVVVRGRVALLSVT